MSKNKNKYFAGGLGFKTKKLLHKHCKGILNGNMGELEGEDLAVMLDVLKMHPRYKDKVGKRSYTIFVGSCPFNAANNQFQIVFTDREVVDFSYYKAIQGYSPESKLKETLRQSIDCFHKAYRKNYIKENMKKGYLLCEVTGLKIKPKEMHLDHYPRQFEEIILDWMIINELRVSSINLIPPEGYGFTWSFEDPELLKSFISYHNEVVQYRGVLAKVNLQREKSKLKLPK